MSYFATAYTIHFDDTMAYGSHHFLTGFKFQCAAREALLYGDLIFDKSGVPQALDQIHLFTADAYSRNLRPTFLGDRVAILITLEEWGRVSARFCYRVLNREGLPICAGFQNMICADAKSGAPIPLPEALREAFDAIRAIEEPSTETTFRDNVLKSVEATENLFPEHVRAEARNYLADRYPTPKLIGRTPSVSRAEDVVASHAPPSPTHASTPEVWVFPGQGAFDAQLLSKRILAADDATRDQLRRVAEVVGEQLAGDVHGLLSGQPDRCHAAVLQTPDLSQVAIHLQSVMGAWQRWPSQPPALLLGHSFGELAALNVAGCFDLATAIQIVCHRVQAIRQHAPADGGLLVVPTSRRVVTEEITVGGFPDVVIAGRNHEQQTVASGPQDQLDALRKQLQAQQTQAISITSPTCFHHPLLRSAAQAWLSKLRELPLSAPRQPVYSPIGRRLITESDDIASVLASQFLRPFDLQGAIEDLSTGGFREFVDCGSTGSLGRLLVKAGGDELHITSVAETDPTSIGPPPNGAPQEGIRSLAGDDASEAPPRPRPRIAIVRQGCLLPGRVTSPASLHSAIMEGRQGIIDQREVDPDWEHDFYAAELAPDSSTSALAGRVDDEDIQPPPGIDAQQFAGFSRAQQLLCCALAPCADVLRDSGRLLCLLGTTADGFRDQDQMAALRQAGADVADPQIAARLGTTPAAGLGPFQAVQAVLDAMIGPEVKLRLIDAACASSLYAVALGMYALESFEADVVLAGGLFCPGPGNNCLFSQFGGLTATGCRPFDAGADGVAFAEGAAMVVLQRLDEAREAGHEVVSVVRGAGLSSDGRSPSANVPQSAGQAFALQRCYDAYRIPPNSVAGIEGHGTSTPVGDATEIRTLDSFFSGQTASPLPLHSLKGLLGHAGWAAGTASLIAANESLRRGVFPAQAFFREPTAALKGASSTLRVLTTPELLQGQIRIGIDGFGFGGANAHVVVESAADVLDEPRHAPPVKHEDDDPVVVAWHQMTPQNQTQFDRDTLELPESAVCLPDLADDMDVTQALMLSLADGVLSKLGSTAASLRTQTGIVLALEGKTERAVEATTRILAPRLARQLAGLEAAQQVTEARTQCRPSGPYTLQCMMPNVSAGRAALAFNLQGPNFVVDAGPDSLAAAFVSTQQLLQSGGAGGAELVIVASIRANRWPAPGTGSMSGAGEHAVAFAVTTRRQARTLGLPIQAPLETLLAESQDRTSAGSPLEACLDRLEGRSSTLASQRFCDEFPIHRPVWVEAAAEHSPAAAPSRCVVIVREAHPGLLSDLMRILPAQADDYRLLLIGASDTSTVPYDAAHTIRFDPGSPTAEAALQQLSEFAPDLVVAVDSPTEWDLESVLAKIDDNRLCESVFMVMQALRLNLETHQTEFWGLFPGAWHGQIHPITGAVSGLLKSTQREFPAARVGVLSTRTPSVDAAWRQLVQERGQHQRHEVEVVFDGDCRRVRRLRAIDPDQESPQAASAIPLTRESVVIATGGARGVTAVLLDALLSDHQCTVIALGRSPLDAGPPNFDSPEVEQAYYQQSLAADPNRSPAVMRRQFESARARWEADANIKRLAQLGGQVQYVPVDVTSAREVDRVVQEVIAEHGRIDLLIHGAGVQWSKKLKDRTLPEFRTTYKVKVGGLQNLARSCHRHLGTTVATHVLTSAYSIFGNDGQHDYGAANETMDRLCGLRINGFPTDGFKPHPSPASTGSDSQWSSIAWSAWNGIGMTRGSEYRKLAQKRNLALLTADAGKHVFRTVLHGQTHAAINVPLSPSERTQYGVRTLPPQNGRPVERTLEQPLSLAQLPCLPFHQARGKETLPGAWIVDFMVRAAMQLHGRPARFFTVESMKFMRFLRVFPEHDANVRVIVDVTPTGYTAWLIGNVLNPDGVTLLSDQIFAKARLAAGGDPRAALNGALKNGKGEIRIAHDPYCAGAGTVDLSGPFDCLPQIEIGPLGRRAIFRPQVTGDWGGVVPSLLLDASLRVAGMHCIPGALHVPTRIARVTLPVGFSTDSAAAAGWRIRTSDPVAEGDHIRCDRVEVTDPGGELMLLVEGAWVTRLR